MASKSDTPTTGGRSSGDSSSPRAIREGNADPTDIGAGELQTNVGSTEQDSDAPFPQARGADPWAPSQ